MLNGCNLNALSAVARNLQEEEEHVVVDGKQMASILGKRRKQCGDPECNKIIYTASLGEILTEDRDTFCSCCRCTGCAWCNNENNQCGKRTNVTDKNPWCSDCKRVRRKDTIQNGASSRSSRVKAEADAAGAADDGPFDGPVPVEEVPYATVNIDVPPGGENPIASQDQQHQVAEQLMERGAQAALAKGFVEKEMLLGAADGQSVVNPPPAEMACNAAAATNSADQWKSADEVMVQAEAMVSAPAEATAAGAAADASPGAVAPTRELTNLRTSAGLDPLVGRDLVMLGEQMDHTALVGTVLARDEQGNYVTFWKFSDQDGSCQLTLSPEDVNQFLQDKSRKRKEVDKLLTSLQANVLDKKKKKIRVDEKYQAPTPLPTDTTLQSICADIPRLVDFDSLFKTSGERSALRVGRFQSMLSDGLCIEMTNENIINSFPGAITYKVRNFGRWKSNLMLLLSLIPWSKFETIHNQPDGLRRLLYFHTMILYFESAETPRSTREYLPLCKEVVHCLTVLSNNIFSAFGARRGRCCSAPRKRAVRWLRPRPRPRLLPPRPHPAAPCTVPPTQDRSLIWALTQNCLR